MPRDCNVALVRRFFSVGPSGVDLDSADVLLASDFVLHAPLHSSPGIQGSIEFISACRAAFDRLDVPLKDIVVVVDRVAVRFTASGVHKGAFIGLPATGKKIHDNDLRRDSSLHSTHSLQS